eukprot:2232070-Pleurochrysis_carterae.AAC.1
MAKSGTGGASALPAASRRPRQPASRATAIVSASGTQPSQTLFSKKRPKINKNKKHMRDLYRIPAASTSNTIIIPPVPARANTAGAALTKFTSYQSPARITPNINYSSETASLGITRQP